MNARFYCRTMTPEGTATLAGSEAHHLLHVLRAQMGDEVTLFDGQGWECTACITACSRQTVQLQVRGRRRVDRESPHAVTLGVSLPKGDRQRFLVEKCVELGVRRLVPLAVERSVSQPRATSLDRLRRNVIEASKQCGRNQLMEITEPHCWTDYLKSGTATVRWVADPGGEPFRGGASAEGETVRLAVGPEGGFSPRELALSRQHGWSCISLGSRILRVETAALALAARWIC
jgi:16S rRNA (uracil1498-N3)-methyltransferase